MATNINLPNISQNVRVDTKSLTVATNRSIAFAKRMKALREEVQQTDRSLQNLTRNSRRLNTLAKSMDRLKSSAAEMGKSLKETERATSRTQRTMSGSQRTVQKLSRSMLTHAEVTRHAAEEVEDLNEQIRRIPKRSTFAVFSKNLPKVRKEIDAAARDRKTTLHVDIDKKQMQAVLGTLSGLGGKGGLSFWGKIAMPAGIVSGLMAALPVVGSLAQQLVVLSQAALLAFPAMGLLAGAAGVLALGMIGLGESAAKSVVQMKSSLKDVGKDWSSLRTKVQDAMFKGVGPAIKSLSDKALPQFRDEILKGAAAWNTLFKDQLKFISSARSLKQIEGLIGGSTKLTKLFSSGLTALLSIFLDLADAGMKPFTDLMNGMTGGIARFSQSVRDANDSGALTQMMYDGMAMAGRLWKVVLSLGSAIGGLVSTAKLAGADFIGIMQSFAAGLDNLFNDASVQESLASAFGGVSDLIKGITGNMEPFKQVIVALGPAISEIGNYLGQVFAKALPYIGDMFTALAPAIGAVVTTMGPFVEVVDALGPGLVRAAEAMAPVAIALSGYVGKAVADISPIIGSFVNLIADNIPAAFEVLRPVFDMLSSLISTLAPKFNSLVTAMGPFIAKVLEVGNSVTSTLAPILGSVLTGAFGFLIDAVTKVVGWMTSLLTKFTELSPGMQTAIVAALTITGVFLKLGGVFGIVMRMNAMFVKVIGKLGPILNIVKTGIMAVGTALKFLFATPVGLVILAIVALVAALVLLYKKNEDFRNFINGVWAKVKEVISAVVDWFVQTAWPAMKEAFSKFMDIVKELWANVIKPTFEKIGEIFKWLWENVVKPTFDNIGKIVSFVWGNILKPIFQLIGFAFKVAAGIIQANYNLFIKPAIDAFGALAKWLWENAIKPAWDKVSEKFKILAVVIKNWWDQDVKPKIDAFKEGVGRAKDAVSAAVDAIKAKWATLKAAISGPLDSIKQFINANFIGPINSLLDKLGVTTFRIPAIGGGSGSSAKGTGRDMSGGQQKATGGIINGNSPNATADNIPAWLTAKEWVIKQKSSLKMMRKYPGFLEYINRHGKPPGYATGGAVSSPSGGGSPISHIGAAKYGVGGEIVDFMNGPVEYGKSLMNKVISSLGLKQFLGAFSLESGKRLASGVMEKVKRVLEETFGPGGEGGGGNTYGVGVGHALSRVRAMLIPGTSITSTYRDPARNARAGGHPQSLHMNRSNPAVDIGGTTSALDRLYPILRAAGGWRQLKWRVAGHYDHIHAAAEGGPVPSDASKGATPFVADAGARLAPGLNLLNNKLGKPEPLVRADLLDTRLAALQAAIERNTDALVARSSGSQRSFSVGNGGGAIDREAIAAMVESMNRNGNSSPSTLVVVDVDGKLVGRMRVEAEGALGNLARRVQNHAAVGGRKQ